MRIPITPVGKRSFHQSPDSGNGRPFLECRESHQALFFYAYPPFFPSAIWPFCREQASLIES